MTTYRKVLYPLAAALVLVAAPAAAQEDRGIIGAKVDFNQIKEQVNAALPPIIGSENSDLAKKLLEVSLGEPLSKTFSLQSAIFAVFSRFQPVLAPDCSRTMTPTGEPDQGECNMTQGTPGGEGAFKQLSVSKNIGVGNIRHVSRPGLVNPADLKPINVTDDEAQKVAVAHLLKFYGIPASELPLPPEGARQTAFVKTLTLESVDEKGERFQPLGIHKLVMIPRALQVPGLTDPFKRELRIPAPGLVKVLIGLNSAVIAVSVENWRELRPNPELNPANAKTRDDLIQEIAEDLLNDGGGRIARMSAHIVYGVDWRGTHGLLVPAVLVNVTPVSGTLDASQFGQITEQKIGTAGTQREFALIGAPQREPGETR